MIRNWIIWLYTIISLIIYIYIYYVIIFPKKGEERSTRRGRRARGVTYVFPEWIDCDGRRNEWKGDCWEKKTRWIGVGEESRPDKDLIQLLKWLLLAWERTISPYIFFRYLPGDYLFIPRSLELRYSRLRPARISIHFDLMMTMHFTDCLLWC